MSVISEAFSAGALKALNLSLYWLGLGNYCLYPSYLPIDVSFQRPGAPQALLGPVLEIVALCLAHLRHQKEKFAWCHVCSFLSISWCALACLL